MRRQAGHDGAAQGSSLESVKLALLESELLHKIELKNSGNLDDLAKQIANACPHDRSYSTALEKACTGLHAPVSAGSCGRHPQKAARSLAGAAVVAVREARRPSASAYQLGH